jgi:hypothetical protein
MRKYVLSRPSPSPFDVTFVAVAEAARFGAAKAIVAVRSTRATRDL